MTKPGPTAPAPTKPLSDKEFEQLLGMIRIQCTASEICNILEMSEDTLGRRLQERGYANFADCYKKHGDEGKSSLRRNQWKSAQEGNVTMQIWLGKQMLGQKDKTDFSSEDGTMAPKPTMIQLTSPDDNSKD